MFMSISAMSIAPLSAVAIQDAAERALRGLQVTVAAKVLGKKENGLAR